MSSSHAPSVVTMRALEPLTIVYYPNRNNVQVHAFVHVECENIYRFALIELFWDAKVLI